MKNYFETEIIPENELDRLQALKYFDIISELPNDYFTGLARIIAQTFNVPIALVSIVAEDFVNFPGNFGMEGVLKIERGLSLCSLAILKDEPTVFQNALDEPCLIRNPLVHGNFGLRFYAGAPIITKEGFAIGTVCIVDKTVREFTEEDVLVLTKFAGVAMEQLYLNHQHKL